jgi:heat shock protein HtpX
VRLALRLSLAARALVVASVVVPMAVFLSLVLAFFGAIFGLGLSGVTQTVLETAAAAPRVASVTPLPAWAAAVVAGCVLVVVFYGWERVAPYTRDDHLIPPSGPAQWALVLVVLVACYEVVVEPPAALLILLGDGPLLALAPAALGALVGVWGSILWLRAEIRALRELSVTGSEPADPEAHAALVGAVDRLSAAAGVAAPEVRVLGAPRPLAHVVGTRRDAVLVVSTGLLDALSPAEREAVLAHEVAHLANGDSRLMSLALAPVVLAEELFVDEDGPGTDPRDWPWYALGVVLRAVGQFGAAVFAVGRERAADETAAKLTGDPAALASALATLAGRDPPETDLREWSESVAALGVLPSLAPEGERAWSFDTHPPVEERIERLRELAAAQEGR